MALIIPKTSELYSTFIANFESKINQSVPLPAKAFLRVLSVVLAVVYTGLYKFGVERARQNLALTATGEDLDQIGIEYGKTRKPAEATTLTATLPATTGTLIPSTTDFTADATAVPYDVDADVTSVAGTATLSLTSQSTGENTNLANGATLTIGSPLAGAESTATVTATTNEGLDRETDDEYRRRILTAIRTVGGGGNSADYREWSEEVADVAAAYPYSGKPIIYNFTATDITFTAADSSINSPTAGFVAQGIVPNDHITISGSASNDSTRHVVSVTATKIIVDTVIVNEAAGPTITIVNESLPGDRTVFIESRIGDGVPTAGLLTAVRTNITTDPDTGEARPCLGDTDELLYIEPISRSDFYIQLSNLVAGSEAIATTKSKIETALTTYFSNSRPFIVGLDFEPDRTDIITDPSISLVIQGVLQSVGATADAVGFAVGAAGPYTQATYTLGQGELAAFKAIAYV
jgi:phage-related baseplate assembly protein